MVHDRRSPCATGKAMSHMVIWSRRAIDQVTTLWMDNDSAVRSAITKAVHQIDQQLKSSPAKLGESRPDRRRIHFIQPLAILFEVRHGVARVIDVWDARRKR